MKDNWEIVISRKDGGQEVCFIHVGRRTEVGCILMLGR